MLDRKHMMDPWSRELVAKCHCEGLRLNDPSALSVIASVKREIRRETVQIEARHASIRRGVGGLECPNAHSVVCTPVCRTADLGGQAHEQARQARAKATLPA